MFIDWLMFIDVFWGLLYSQFSMFTDDTDVFFMFVHVTVLADYSCLLILIFIDAVWCLLMFSDVHWCFLLFTDVYCCLLMFIHVYWRWLMVSDVFDVYCCFLLVIHVYSCSLMFNSSCWLVTSHVYIDVHVVWCSLMFIDVYWCLYCCSLKFVDDFFLERRVQDSRHFMGHRRTPSVKIETETTVGKSKNTMPIEFVRPGYTLTQTEIVVSHPRLAQGMVVQILTNIKFSIQIIWFVCGRHLWLPSSP